MKKQQSKTQNEVLSKLIELEELLRRKNDKPLNFNQAAEYLGFSHSYLYKLTSRKIIPCHRPTGKMLFFSKAELDDWIFSSKKSTRHGGQELKSEKEEDSSTSPSTELRAGLGMTEGNAENDEEPP